MGKFCKHCGAELVDNTKFCTNCGNKVEEADCFDMGSEPVAPTPEAMNYDNSTESGERTESVNSKNVYTNENKESLVLAIISLVTGILSILCCCFVGLSGILSVAALACGIISLVLKKGGKGMAIAGIVCGAVGLCLFTVMLIGILSNDSITSDILSELDSGNFEYYF